MSIYYKYAPYGTKIVILSYVDDFFYLYNHEALGKWFVDDLVKIFHVNFLGYAHCFMLIIISQMKDHSISVDQAIYDTSNVAKYVYTDTVKTSTKFYKPTLPYDMIFTKYDVYTSYKKVWKLTSEFNIHYRACIGSLICSLSTIVYFIFPVHKLEKFSSKPGKAHFEGLVHLLIYIRYNETLGLNYYYGMKYGPSSDLLRQAIIETENQLMAFFDSS